MKKVQVNFKTLNGNIVPKFVNTSGSAKKASEALHKEFKFWEVVSYEVIKTW